MSNRHNTRFKHIVKIEHFSSLTGRLPCYADACICLATNQHYVALHVFCLLNSRYTTVFFVPCPSHTLLAKIIPFFHKWYYLPHAGNAVLNTSVIALAHYFNDFLLNSDSYVYRRVSTSTDLIMMNGNYVHRPVFLCKAIKASSLRHMVVRPDVYFNGQATTSIRLILEIDLDNPPPEVGNRVP